jgi:DNA-binding protein YbaB
MEKTNTNNYNTPYSKVYNFKNFNADTEIKDLGKTKRSFVKNYDDVYELPNNKKMYFNKVTKTMQSLSKDEIDDKIEAAEEYKEDEKSNEEYYGAAEGAVTISINGEGIVKKIVFEEIKKVLRNIGGEKHLILDGEEVNIYPNNASHL